MNESLNDFAVRYAGLLGALGLIGFVLTVIFGVLAVYFYYNPRREKYRLRYKIFAHDISSVLLYFKARNASSRGEEYLFDAYVDVWNAGQDSIGPEVVRGPMQIFLERDATDTGIRSVELVSESTGGAGGFEVRQADGKVELTWQHFDPSQAVRLRLMTNRPLRHHDIGLIGKGLRLSVGQSATAEGGWFRTALLPLCVAVLVFVVGGMVARTALLIVNQVDPNNPWVVVLGLPVLFVGFLLACAPPILAGAGFVYVFDRIFNSRSPIERSEGVPSVGVPTVISKQLYLDFLESLEPAELEGLLRQYDRAAGAEPVLAVSFGRPDGK